MVQNMKYIMMLKDIFGNTSFFRRLLWNRGWWWLLLPRAIRSLSPAALPRLPSEIFCTFAIRWGTDWVIKKLVQLIELKNSFPKMLFSICPLILHFSFLRHLPERKSEVSNYFRRFAWIFTVDLCQVIWTQPRPRGYGVRFDGQLLFQWPFVWRFVFFCMRFKQDSDLPWTFVTNILPPWLMLAHEKWGFFVVWIPEVYVMGFSWSHAQKKTLKEKDLHSPRAQEVTVSGVRGLPSWLTQNPSCNTFWEKA